VVAEDTIKCIGLMAKCSSADIASMETPTENAHDAAASCKAKISHERSHSRLVFKVACNESKPRQLDLQTCCLALS
jgi:hypothetical protein